MDELLEAAIAEIAARGYRATSVEHILKRAGVSRNAFYARYESKETAAMAALREILASPITAERPAEAKVALIDSHAIPAAAPLRRQALDREAHRIADALEAEGPRALDVARAIAGGIERIAVTRLHWGTTKELPGMTDALARWTESYRELAQRADEVPGPGDLWPSRRRGRAPGTLMEPERRGKLPPGPRAEPRSFVVHSQHDRILDAVAVIVAADGFDALTTRALTAEAEVSLATLYEHFESTDAAFEAALLTGARGIVQAALPEAMARTVWRERIAAAIDAVATFLSEEPAFARIGLVDAMAAGPAGLEIQVKAMNVLIAALEDGYRIGTDPQPDHEPYPWEDHDLLPADLPLIAEAVAGGIWELCAIRVRDRRQDELPRLAPLLGAFALTPITGLDQAIDSITTARADLWPDLVPSRGQATG